MVGSQEITPEQHNGSQAPQHVLREFSNENMDSVASRSGSDSKSASQELLVFSPPGSPLALRNACASNEAPAAHTKQSKPTLTFSSYSAQNIPRGGTTKKTSHISIPKIKKTKDSISRIFRQRKIPKKEDGNHDLGFNMTKGMGIVAPELLRDFLLREACNPGGKEVGVEEGIKRAKIIEDSYCQ